MSRRAEVVLEPRKSPVQVRSAATVEAILQATVQVLLSVGKQRLTTTRVAARAGVSVGTLYQYFPNKGALLQAALEKHLDGVTLAVEQACAALQAETLDEMGRGLVSAFVDAKTRDLKASAALYAVSADVDGVKVLRQTNARMNAAMVAMLETSAEPLGRDLKLVAAMLQGAMTGVSRRFLEVRSPQAPVAAMREELLFLACTYLRACAGPGWSKAAGTP